MSFVQVASVSNLAERAAAQEKATTRAMQRIVQVARKHKNWQLASLAVHMKLDAFVKVHEAMDKMLVQLKEQQKAEYAKWESCKADLDQTEDKIKTKTQTKDDLTSKHKDLTNTLATVGTEIDRLQTEVAEMQVALKEAGEQRKAANGLFQTTMSDQRATIAILNMALGRLKEFYTPKAALVEVHLHSAAAPPPPKPAGYEKSGSSGGVLQLLAMIISDAERTEVEIQAGEQKAQEEYAVFVQSATASIESDRVAIEEAEAQSASASSGKSETEEAQLSNNAELTKLGEFLTAVHGDCDFLLKYFDVRQKSRAEEMDAIGEAKAILSGADFA
jgi:myosin heavy subunit